MIVVRGEDPGPFSRHREYVTYLQIVFNYRCAYCLTPDSRLGGLEAMKVEHLRPASRHPHLKLAWINLYYSCDVCNNRKSDHPRANEEEQGRQSKMSWMLVWKMQGGGRLKRTCRLLETQHIGDATF